MGTGVATALKITHWPTPFLTRPDASRLGGLFQLIISSTAEAGATLLYNIQGYDRTAQGVTVNQVQRVPEFRKSRDCLQVAGAVGDHR